MSARTIRVPPPSIIVVRVETERKRKNEKDGKEKKNRIIENLDHAAVGGRCAVAVAILRRSCDR